MPIFFAHGEDDKLIPVEQARQLAETMKDKKTFQYTEIPNGGHDSPCFIQAAVDFLLMII
jgi:pimeloyl-ACP methyl ester carboxylesterase